MSNEITKQDNTNLVIKPKPPSFRRGIAATRFNNEQTIKQTDPTTVPNRIGMIFDDSGSMGSREYTDSKISNAHTAVKNFTASCNMNDTSIAIYPLNMEPKPLTIDYDILNMWVLGLTGTGGTPLYTTLLKLIDNENITRAVVFSDGSPTDSKLVGSSESWDSKPKDFALSVVKKYTDKEIAIDTIYLGTESDIGYTDDTEDADYVYAPGYNEMKELAKLTNGIFIHFKDATSLSKNLKYLAPKYRALLANAELKEKISIGETI